MKILSAAQIRQLDQFTIEQEPITSIDLMERAAQTFANWLMEQYPSTDQVIHIYCGTGNNGGDGLAVARILYAKFYPVSIFLCKISEHLSSDNSHNLKRLPADQAIPVHLISIDQDFPKPDNNPILIDAIFGSGLNRELEGYWANLMLYLNEQYNVILSIDIPSGVFADRVTSSPSIHATHTFSFELPKLAFLFPQNHLRIGVWHCRSIALSRQFILECPATNHYIGTSIIRSIYKARSKYDHKGTYGHALLIVGKYGSIGAALLASKAALKSGCGLLTVHVPSSALNILQSTVPEAMASVDKNEFFFSNVPDFRQYQAIGTGCGLGTNSATKQALLQLLITSKAPLVLDADALNIIAQRKALELIPRESILTPHLKEFERLFGPSADDFARNDLQRKMAVKLGVVLILKGAHTCIAMPDGTCYFNSTGNPGMATAGSGDVLTGILTSLLAQGYSSEDASILGVYLHGLSGDLAAQAEGQEALLAGDIVQYLGKAFQKVNNSL